MPSISIAFLIMAHTDLPQLERLCKKIVEYGDVYIHVDKKVEDCYVVKLKEYVETLSGNVCILNNRYSVCWGGYSQLYATQALLRKTLKEGRKRYDRIFLLSGLCYPLFSKQELWRFCEKQKDTELITVYNISRGKDKHQKNKVRLYHFFRDIPLSHNSLMRRIIVGGSMLLLKFLGIRKKPYVLCKGKPWDVFFSSQWFGLTGECANYVLKQLTNNKEVSKYFRTSRAPDEMVVATIVMNSPYGKRVRSIDEPDFEKLSMLHYLHYTDKIWSYDERDYDTLIQSGKPFVRKLLTGKSEKLIEKIDGEHANSEQKANE